MSAAFSGKRPLREHLLRAGVGEEVFLLRRQVDQAFGTVESTIAGLAASAISYNDGLVPGGVLGANNVQTALDAIKTLLVNEQFPLVLLFDGAATGATDTFMACATGTSVATTAMRFTLPSDAVVKKWNMVVWQNASLSADATVKLMSTHPAVSGVPALVGGYTQTINHLGVAPYAYAHQEDQDLLAGDGIDVELITSGTGTVRLTVVVSLDIARF